MSLQKIIAQNPVRLLTAVMSFGTTIITVLSLSQGWSPETVTQVSAVWTAVVALVGSFITYGQVIPISKIDGLVHDTIVSLAPLADAAKVAEEAVAAEAQKL